jgi:hypothetical protein
VKDNKGLLLHIILNEALLVPRTRCVISNPRSQGGTKKGVKAIKLWQEVLNLRMGGLGTWSIHKVHLFLLENHVGMDPRLQIHSKLVLEAKQAGKLSHYGLILLPICHPHKLMSINIKADGGSSSLYAMFPHFSRMENSPM